MCIRDRFASDGGEPRTRCRHRSQFAEQFDTIADGPCIGRIEEREVTYVAEVEGCHLQQDRGEVGALDLRIGELRAGIEVIFGIQADADAVRRSPASPCPLVRAGLRDRLDRQALHLEPVSYTHLTLPTILR